MKLPWVSRERYEEMKRDLTARLDKAEARLESEQHKLVDYIAEHSVGTAVYNPKPEPVPEVRELEPHEVLGETPEQERRAELKRAIEATGTTNTRIVMNAIDRERARKYGEKRNQVPAEAATYLKQIDDAVAEGTAAARSAHEAS